MKSSVGLFLVASAALLPPSAPAAENLSKVVASTTDIAAVRTLTWGGLTPFDYRPDKIIESYRQKGERLWDSDIEATELMGELRRELEAAPAVPSLNNSAVKLSGYVVALESDGSSISGVLARAVLRRVHSRAAAPFEPDRARTIQETLPHAQNVRSCRHHGPSHDSHRPAQADLGDLRNGRQHH